MQLTEEEKKNLQEKIDQEPAARKERNEKTIGISTGVIGGLLFPIGVILGTYWFLRGRRTRGAYALMTVAWVIGIQWGVNLFTKASFTLLGRLLQ